MGDDSQDNSVMNNTLSAKELALIDSIGADIEAEELRRSVYEAAPVSEVVLAAPAAAVVTLPAPLPAASKPYRDLRAEKASERKVMKQKERRERARREKSEAEEAARKNVKLSALNDADIREVASRRHRALTDALSSGKLDRRLGRIKAKGRAHVSYLCGFWLAEASLKKTFAAPTRWAIGQMAEAISTTQEFPIPVLSADNDPALHRAHDRRTRNFQATIRALEMPGMPWHGLP